MKILQSKYATDRQHLIADDEDYRIVVDTQSWGAKYNPYARVLSQKLGSVNMDDNDYVIAIPKLAEMTQCTDFHSVSYSHKLGKTYETELCYYHPELEVFVVLSCNLNYEYEQELFEDELLTVDSIYYDRTHEHALAIVDTFIKTYVQKHRPKEAKVSILLKERYGFELKTHKIKPYPIDLHTMYNDDFLAVHEHIESSLQSTNKGIVLLHGIAGSGKSNYIKWLSSQVPDKRFIFVPTSIIHQLTDPAFISLLIEHKNSVLVLEDCENYIAERTIGNQHTDVVTSILNIADGLLSDVLECQLICTFNSDLSKIDSALLRKGRLIAEYKFKELSVEKANAYLSSQGEVADVTKPISLADLTNRDADVIKEAEVVTKFGFI